MLTDGGGVDEHDPDEVLAPVRALKAQMQAERARRAKQAEGNTSSQNNRAVTAEFDLAGATQVAEMNRGLVLNEIERQVVHVLRSLLVERGFSFTVPSRAQSNQVYVPELDRIVLKTAATTREFGRTASVRKTAITARILGLAYSLLQRGIHITKRDLFYTDVKLFVKQADSDGVLDDVATMLGCTRYSINVVASEKGIIIGRVRFVEDGDPIDCTRMGVGGKSIPPFLDKIKDIQSDADFILLVEKDAAFARLAEDRFYQRYPCIIITAKVRSVSVATLSCICVFHD